ncbi:hypothetical protein EWM64_g10739 [Hericium alpestre]|uniref:BTB domain-containing protein n=1 Tax=Hericium alpestre TaxID=135208 RepID=A0A4Y9ZHH6_9AGAM|nr:hypothetical protein EWM64_g10739 [Hericium alpestre]
MTESNATWRKHPDLWLPDGNVVLVCQDIGYRVNESVLRLHSPVFNDLFLVASKDAEGSKILFMNDDAEDMYHFLKAMYLRYYGRMKSEPPFPLIASLLRMATKYMFAESARR